MRLTKTTETLIAFLSGAADPTVKCYVSFRDVVPKTNELGQNLFSKGDNQYSAIADTTEVVIGDAPGQGFVREFDYINFYNEDNASVTLTVAIDVSGTNKIIRVVTLATLEMLEWGRGYGWKAMTVAGAIK